MGATGPANPECLSEVVLQCHCQRSGCEILALPCTCSVPDSTPQVITVNIHFIKLWKQHEMQAVKEITEKIKLDYAA